MNEILYLSGLELAKKIKSKELSPLEVVKIHIDRAVEINPEVNAIAEKNFTAALKMAEDYTERVVNSTKPKDLPPYFGVPFTVKEMIAVKNLHRTAGDIHYRDRISNYNSTAVQRMIDAGAIPIATTNVPELGFWFECANPIYGKTCNPYDLSRTSGGSSGGEGALIASGGSPMGLGSDIGGSIRIPSSFCGIFGHKPTNKLVPLTGHFPYSQEQLTDKIIRNHYPFLTLGPMARKASDLFSMLEIMKGPDEYDPEVKNQALLNKKITDWTGRKIFIMPSPHFHLARGTTQECQDAVTKVGHYFAALDAEVQELNPRLWVKGVELWTRALKMTQSQSFKELLNPEGKIDFFSETLKILKGHSNYTLPSLLLTQLEDLKLLEKNSALNSSQIWNEIDSIRQQLQSILGPDGLLILPTHPRVAPTHNSTIWSPFDFIYAGFFNVLGNPATSAPVGLNQKGLPLSVQIVGAHFRDDLTLSAAEAIEIAFGGWVMPK